MTDYCENGKPKDCRYCYYYGRHGCMLKVCYYDRPKPETKPVSECDDCPYGKCGPCMLHTKGSGRNCHRQSSAFYRQYSGQDN